MAKIELVPSFETRKQQAVEELRERAKQQRKHPTRAERKLQLELNKGYWRFRRKKVWVGELYDLWCSVLRVGVRIHPEGTSLGAVFRGERTVILHFSEEEVLEEMWAVVQVVQAACRSQDALERVRRTGHLG